MKHRCVSTLAFAVALYYAPAFAQHGHGVGGGSGMGSSHANANSNGAKVSSVAATHGKTMDQLLAKNTKLSNNRVVDGRIGAAGLFQLQESGTVCGRRPRQQESRNQLRLPEKRYDWDSSAERL